METSGGTQTSSLMQLLSLVHVTVVRVSIYAKGKHNLNELCFIIKDSSETKTLIRISQLEIWNIKEWNEFVFTLYYRSKQM